MKVLTKAQIKGVRAALGLITDLRVKYKLDKNESYKDAYSYFMRNFDEYQCTGKEVEYLCAESKEGVIRYWIAQTFRGFEITI